MGRPFEEGSDGRLADGAAGAAPAVAAASELAALPEPLLVAGWPVCCACCWACCGAGAATTPCWLAVASAATAVGAAGDCRGAPAAACEAGLGAALPGAETAASEPAGADAAPGSTLLAGEARCGDAAAAAAAAGVPPLPTAAGADAVRAMWRADPGCLPRSFDTFG